MRFQIKVEPRYEGQQLKSSGGCRTIAIDNSVRVRMYSGLLTVRRPADICGVYLEGTGARCGSRTILQVG